MQEPHHRTNSILTLFENFLGAGSCWQEVPSNVRIGKGRELDRGIIVTGYMESSNRKSNRDGDRKCTCSDRISDFGDGLAKFVRASDVMLDMGRHDR